MATDTASIADISGNATPDKVSTPSVSTAPTTPIPTEDPTTCNLDVKFVDSRYKEKNPCGWEYEDTLNAGDVPAELVQPLGIDASDDSWAGYCFVVVRKHPTPEQKARGIMQIVIEIVIKNKYLLKACEDVIGGDSRVSWSSQPVKVSTYYFILAVFCSFMRSRMAIARPEARSRVLPEI